MRYSFPDGVYDPDSSGRMVRYTGFHSRTAYLPDNPQGNEILALLQIAWERRHLFKVGQSLTMAWKKHTVCWNTIPHKTRLNGGPSVHGYPDETYFARVKGDLQDKGITINDIPSIQESK